MLVALDAVATADKALENGREAWHRVARMCADRRVEPASKPEDDGGKRGKARDRGNGKG